MPKRRYAPLQQKSIESSGKSARYSCGGHIKDSEDAKKQIEAAECAAIRMIKMELQDARMRVEQLEMWCEDAEICLECGFLAFFKHCVSPKSCSNTVFEKCFDRA